jgi:hypothetical protein
MSEETEVWVQCHKCEKWRNVTSYINENAPWECRYNIFSPDYNHCSADQEPMPTEEEDEEEEDGEEFAIETVSDDDTEMFVPSSCPCEVCTGTNTAVSEWGEYGDHPIPLVRMIRDAITGTENVAHATEDDKQFLHGTYINLRTPTIEAARLSKSVP